MEPHLAQLHWGTKILLLIIYNNNNRKQHNGNFYVVATAIEENCFETVAERECILSFSGLKDVDMVFLLQRLLHQSA